MSFVVLYTTDKGAVIKGDSRMCNNENDTPFEGYYKVFKINENLIMGCTGGFVIKSRPFLRKRCFQLQKALLKKG